MLNESAAASLPTSRRNRSRRAVDIVRNLHSLNSWWTAPRTNGPPEQRPHGSRHPALIVSPRRIRVQSVHDPEDDHLPFGNVNH
jgi:hypothetical protein